MKQEKTIIPVIIDKSGKLEYEFEGFLRKTLNAVLVNVLGLLPKKHASKLFSKTSKDGDTVKQNATTHRALEVIYSFNGKMNKDNGTVNGIFTHTWQHLLNSKALRNRLKLVKEQLRQAVFAFSDKKEIKILSLGAGSARAIIETLASLKESNIKFQAMLLDKNEDAFIYGKELAKEYGINKGLIWINGSVFDAEKYCEQKNFYPDIVEMVGFMDYLDEDRSVKLFDRIYALLNKKGIFIGCNIRYNRESKFLTKVLGWPMIYKDEHYLRKIVNKSQFNDSKIIYEPLKVHGFVVCRK